MSDSLSSVCDRSVHFAKFPMLRLSKSYVLGPIVFIQFHPNFI